EEGVLAVAEGEDAVLAAEVLHPGALAVEAVGQGDAAVDVLSVVAEGVEDERVGVVHAGEGGFAGELNALGGGGEARPAGCLTHLRDDRLGGVLSSGGRGEERGDGQGGGENQAVHLAAPLPARRDGRTGANTYVNVCGVRAGPGRPEPMSRSSRWI